MSNYWLSEYSKDEEPEAVCKLWIIPEELINE
jgi:hypothetical protein